MGNAFLQHGKDVLYYRKEWKTLLLLVLFDVLLFSALFAAATLFDTIMAFYEPALVGTWTGYFFLLAYFLIVTLAYSFFKYCCFGFLTKEKKEKGVSFDCFWKFYIWTVVLLGISLLLFGILYLFFSYGLVSLLKSPALLIFTVAYWTVLYLYMQSSQSLFFLDRKVSLQGLAKKTWTILQWNWLWKWGAWNIFFLILFFGVYFGLYLILLLLGKNVTSYGLFYLFNFLIFAFLVCASYFLLFWNRLSVLMFVRNSIKK